MQLWINRQTLKEFLAIPFPRRDNLYQTTSESNVSFIDRDSSAVAPLQKIKLLWRSWCSQIALAMRLSLCDSFVFRRGGWWQRDRTLVKVSWYDEPSTPLYLVASISSWSRTNVVARQSRESSTFTKATVPRKGYGPTVHGVSAKKRTANAYNNLLHGSDYRGDWCWRCWYWLWFPFWTRLRCWSPMKFLVSASSSNHVSWKTVTRR